MLMNEVLLMDKQVAYQVNGDVYFSVTPPTMRSRMSGGNPMLSADDKRKMATAVAERVLSKL